MQKIPQLLPRNLQIPCLQHKALRNASHVQSLLQQCRTVHDRSSIRAMRINHGLFRTQQAIHHSNSN